MKTNNILVIGILLFLYGCATTPISPNTSNRVSVNTSNSVSVKNNSTNCDFNAVQGKEFVFRQRAESLKKYGYMLWKKTQDVIGKELSYKNYSGKRAKVKEQILSDKFGIIKWFVAITENCEKIYSSAGIVGRELTVNHLEQSTGIYFIETLENAKSLIGNYIWTNGPFRIKKSRVLFTPDPNITYKKDNLQKLKVLGIDTMEYGHIFGATPFLLIIETETGKKALLPYSPKYFHKINPVNPNWSNSVVELIKNQKVQRGMTDEQVLLSWGKPQKNNRSVGSYGVHEQWLYGNNQYLYFENNILTSFQTTE